MFVLLIPMPKALVATMTGLRFSMKSSCCRIDSLSSFDAAAPSSNELMNKRRFRKRFILKMFSQRASASLRFISCVFHRVVEQISVLLKIPNESRIRILSQKKNAPFRRRFIFISIRRMLLWVHRCIPDFYLHAYY